MSVEADLNSLSREDLVCLVFHITCDDEKLRDKLQDVRLTDYTKFQDIIKGYDERLRNEEAIGSSTKVMLPSVAAVGKRQPSARNQRMTWKVAAIAVDNLPIKTLVKNAAPSMPLAKAARPWATSQTSA